MPIRILNLYVFETRDLTLIVCQFRLVVLGPFCFALLLVQLEFLRRKQLFLFQVSAFEGLIYPLELLALAL